METLMNRSDGLDVVDELDQFIAEQEHEDNDFAKARRDAEMRSWLVRQLVSHRKARGTTQQQVAERMQVVQSCVSDFERGVGDPHLSTIQRYARANDLELRFGLSSSDGVLESLMPARSTPAMWGPAWNRSRSARGRLSRAS